MNTDNFEHGEHEEVAGRYVWINHADSEFRTYYEVAGDGDVPLVCLHTAGADSRQYRHLLNDDDILEDFTVYAFDMPWHGRSYPPTDKRWWESTYQLTTEFYAGFIMEFVETLDLADPVVMGCSMGGEIVLELAINHDDRVRAIIGLETTEYVPASETGYLDNVVDFLDHPQVNQEVFRPEWIYGLQAPQNPEACKREAWWIYSQAGHGVYAGDIYFYTRDWDARDRLDQIDTDECDVYFLTGEYDFSGRPEDTERVAEQIDGASLEIMDEMGHFPPVENPDAFKEYLEPVLAKILESE
ncbi:alpha/beta fold hydrolase [Saliphagus sp. GCM10025308]